MIIISLEIIIYVAEGRGFGVVGLLGVVGLVGEVGIL